MLHASEHICLCICSTVAPPSAFCSQVQLRADWLDGCVVSSLLALACEYASFFVCCNVASFPLPKPSPHPPLHPQVQLMADWLDGCVASAWLAHADALEAYGLAAQVR